MTAPAFIRSTTGGANFQNYLDLTIDCGTGSDRALLLEVCDVVVGATRYPLSATVGGVTMNVSSVSVDAINGLRYAAFNLTDAGGLPTGSQTVHITMASGSGVGHPLAQASLYGTTTAVAAPVAGGAYSATMTKTLTTTSGQVVVSSYIVDPSGATITASGSAASRVNAADYYHIYSMDVTASGSSTVIAATSPSAVVSFGHAWVLTGTGGASPTAVTLTGPTGGVNGVASTNFTVGTDNPVTSGSVVVTPSSGGGGGTFTPSTVTLTSGATTGTFVYTPASTGAKTISVTNGSSLTNPSSITYTVTSSAPTINTQPTNQTVTTPAAATFSVSATTSGGSLTYQWQRQPAGGGGYTNISGATASSYTTGSTTVTGGSHNNGDTYRVNVTDTNGTTTSTAATLTVNAGGGGGTVTTPIIKNWSGTVQVSTTFPYVSFLSMTGALALTLTNQASNSSGVLTITSMSLASGTSYMMVLWNADGSLRGVMKVTAA